MSLPRMLKINVNQAFLESSLHKGLEPLSSTDISQNIMNSATNAIGPYITTFSKRLSTMSSIAVPRCTLTLKGRRSTVLMPTNTLWNAMLTFVFITMITVISPFEPTVLFSQAAPTKNQPSPKNVINAMSLSYSENFSMPLQLQIEAQVTGKQKLVYLPTTGPSMDYYYLNYRPVYRAGESQIDFWMYTPKGIPAPKTGSLELFDEFGKIRLAVLTPEGTEVPQDIANKNEPFLWKSWVVPKTLDANFDFSEKFKVVLKTSDSYPTSKTDVINKKRADSGLELLVKGKNKHINDSGNADTILSPSNSGILMAQDRQLRIKGLRATPGGKPNPARLQANRASPSNIPETISSVRGQGEKSDYKPYDSSSGRNTEEKVSVAVKRFNALGNVFSVLTFAVTLYYVI